MLEDYTGLVEGFCIMQTQLVTDLREAGLEASTSAAEWATEEAMQSIAQFGA
jgi:hypothetical protein